MVHLYRSTLKRGLIVCFMALGFMSCEQTVTDYVQSGEQFSEVQPVPVPLLPEIYHTESQFVLTPGKVYATSSGVAATLSLQAHQRQMVGTGLRAEITLNRTRGKIE